MKSVLFGLLIGLLLSAQMVAARGLSPSTISALESGKILPSWSPKFTGIIWVTDGQMPHYLRENILADIISSPQSEQEARGMIEDHYSDEQVAEFNKMIDIYKRFDSIAKKHGKVSFGQFSASELDSIADTEFSDDSDRKEFLHQMATKKRQAKAIK